MYYSAYEELISYFRFEFNIYICLLAIIIIGLVKSLLTYRQARLAQDVDDISDNNSKIYELMVSLLAIIGLMNAMFFQGVMSDIPIEAGHVWQDKTMYLFISAVVLFNIQLIFIVLSDLRIKKLRNLYMED